MSRTPITATTIADTGTNLTDATYATLSTGAGNGVKFAYSKNNTIVLKNDTGGAAVFTSRISSWMRASEICTEALLANASTPRHAVTDNSREVVRVM